MPHDQLTLYAPCILMRVLIEYTTIFTGHHDVSICPPTPFPVDVIITHTFTVHLQDYRRSWCCNVSRTGPAQWGGRARFTPHMTCQELFRSIGDFNFDQTNLLVTCQQLLSVTMGICMWAQGPCIPTQWTEVDEWLMHWSIWAFDLFLPPNAHCVVSHASIRQEWNFVADVRGLARGSPMNMLGFGSHEWVLHTRRVHYSSETWHVPSLTLCALNIDRYSVRFRHSQCLFRHPWWLWTAWSCTSWNVCWSSMPAYFVSRVPWLPSHHPPARDWILSMPEVQASRNHWAWNNASAGRLWRSRASMSMGVLNSGTVCPLDMFMVLDTCLGCYIVAVGSSAVMATTPASRVIHCIYVSKSFGDLW